MEPYVVTELVGTQLPVANAGVNFDRFTVEWRGYLKPSYTGWHRLRLTGTSQDFGRLYVDNRLVFDYGTDWQEWLFLNKVHILSNMVQDGELWHLSLALA